MQIQVLMRSGCAAAGKYSSRRAHAIIIISSRALPITASATGMIRGWRGLARPTPAECHASPDPMSCSEQQGGAKPAAGDKAVIQGRLARRGEFRGSYGVFWGNVRSCGCSCVDVLARGALTGASVRDRQSHQPSASQHLSDGREAQRSPMAGISAASHKNVDGKFGPAVDHC